ncbi:MAG: hypothetical protein I4N51_23620, partial [Acinetobacter sp.]|nr:hypothetical protein [Acinetobacter sp.]
IEDVYALPEAEIKSDIEGAREKIRVKYTEKCIAITAAKANNFFITTLLFALS